MGKNIREKTSNCKNYNLKSTSGITLTALVITIIVLLILSGVSISMVLNQEGIFYKAENATDKYGKSEARETLELALGKAQMQKYEEGLTDEQLDNKINEIGELLPKEKPNPNLQYVIVDGYIFEIDRSVPKIIDYSGPSEGVVITATINGLSNGWVKPDEVANISVTGTIKTYSGGNITTVSATKDGTAISGFTIDGDGKYEITGITSNTTIEIYAKDSNNKEDTRSIPITIRADVTAPTLSNAKAEAGSHMKMKISVTATDTESGVAQINYKITPNTVDETTPAEGTLELGKEKEIITTAEGEYTVTFTAKDNVGNTSAQAIAKVTTTDSMTVAEVKDKVNKDNIADYIGTKVIDYEIGAIWRVFYVDQGTTKYPNGYFGDGAGTVYLKRDYDSTKTVNPYSLYRNTTPSTEAVNYMKQLNPLWRESDNGKKEVSNYLENERISASFYDQSIYGNNKNNTYSTYAIGAAPIEMWCKAQNIYKAKYDTSASTIECGIKNKNGYGYTIDGESLVDHQNTKVVNTSIEQSKVITTENYEYLASPSSTIYYGAGGVRSNRVTYGGDETAAFCPVVPLNRKN